jgi:hypothetical protein
MVSGNPFRKAFVLVLFEKKQKTIQKTGSASACLPSRLLQWDASLLVLMLTPFALYFLALFRR